MFGVGKAPTEKTPAETAPQTTYTAPAAPRQDASVTYPAPGTVMEGTLKCKGAVSLKANTTVEGNITASTMTMEQGAIINGSLTMKPAAKAESAKPEQSKK